jgi:DNA repair protein RecO
MRHKYQTKGLVLARDHVGEATTLVSLLTEELGLVRARAQSVRKSGARLAPALATFVENELVLVRGKDGWRIAGAIAQASWFPRLSSPEARACVIRVSGLLLRLAPGEVQETRLFQPLEALLEALTTQPKELYDAAEILAVLTILSILGLDAGELPAQAGSYERPLLERVQSDRRSYIQRINTGILASGL